MFESRTPRQGSTGVHDGARVDADSRLMAEALSLAERGRGRVSPNPVVGALVVRDGVVVGRGWHDRYGGPHAEVVALDAAGDLARGSTVYVTLEPCCVWGNTPPCTDALIRAGVREVVAAVLDPNPEVSGRGTEALRAGGIQVRTGVMAEEATRANAGYLRFRNEGLPSVLLKLAMSLDGRVTPPVGGPRWTSSEDSRELVHAMRADADCVLVGVGTVLVDDPRLTDRRDGEGSRQPSRLVLDTNLRVPPACALAESAREIETIVACGAAASLERQGALEDLGVKVWRVGEAASSGVDAAAVLKRAAEAGKLNVLAEGGPTIASTLLNEGLVDRVAFFVSPVLYGSGGRPAFSELAARLWDPASFTNARWTSVGGDALFEADVAPADPGESDENGRPGSCSRDS